MKYCYNHSNKKDTTIAGNGYSMDFEKIRVEMEFLCAFNKAFWREEFVWLHRNDDIRSERHGHCSHEMPLRVFLMNDKLKSLENGKWKNNACFNLFAERLEALHNNVIEDEIVTRAGKETMNYQVDVFWREYRSTFNDHFKRWMHRNIIFTIASSNTNSARIFAKWWLHEEDDVAVLAYIDTLETVLDEAHGANITAIGTFF